MTSLEGQNSPEDWLAIKGTAFSKKPLKSRLRFIVDWNENERKFNVTCHEGTSHVVKRILAVSVYSKNVNCNKNNGTAASGSREAICSWSGLLSLGEIAYAHQQMCLVEPELENLSLELPEEPRGIWSLIYSMEIPPDCCCKLEHYLNAAAEICGKTLITDTLFDNTTGIDAYLENYGELRQKAYRSDVDQVMQKLDKAEDLRFDVSNMMDMLKHYKQQQKLLDELAVARAELFNIELQPFLDMRELAFNKLLTLQERLMDEYLTEAKRDECAMQYSEWQEDYVKAIEAINDIRIRYFGQCQESTKYILQHLEDDSHRFGQSTWELFGAERIKCFEQILTQDKIQIKQAKQDKLKHQQEKIQQELAVLEDGPSLSIEIKRLQNAAHDLHLKRLDLDLSVLLDEEALLKAQLKELKMEIEEATALQEDEFFDALDSLDGVDEEDVEYEEKTELNKGEDPKVKMIRNKLYRINRKKAKIRNRKQHILNEQRCKVIEKQTEMENQIAHHKIQQKREQNLAALAQKKDFLQTERKKTIERLQKYKLKFPIAKVIKPQQYRECKGKYTNNSGKSASRDIASSQSTSASKSNSKISKKIGSAGNKKQEIGLSTTASLQRSNAKQPSSLLSSPSPPPPALLPPPPPPPLPPPPPPPQPPLLPATAISPHPPPYPSPGGLSGKEFRSGVKNVLEKKLSSTGSSGTNAGVLNLTAILGAKNKLQSRPRADSKPKSDNDAMMSTLNLIREGVRLRKTQNQTDGCSLPSLSREENWEDTELYRAIEKVRQQVQLDDPEESDSDSDFN